MFLFLSPIITNAQINGDKVSSSQDYYIIDEGEHSLEWLFDEKPWFPNRWIAKKKLKAVTGAKERTEFKSYYDLLSRDHFSELVQLVFSYHDVIKIITPDFLIHYFSGKDRTLILFSPRLPTKHAWSPLEATEKNISFRTRVIRIASPYVIYYEAEKNERLSRHTSFSILTAWVSIDNDLKYKKVSTRSN